MKIIKFFVLVVVQFGCITSVPEVTIDAGKEATAPFKHFWKSTGLCPPDPKNTVYKSLLNLDEKFNLALIGAVPNKGIEVVRVHWLLNMIFFTGADNSKYNFNYLDAFIKLMIDHDLIPGFEIMGYPIDTNNHTVIPKRIDHAFWLDIMNQIATRYLDRFGLGEVSKWKFETWNEPDLRDYNLLNFTLPEYLQYVQGSADGLQKAFARRNSTIRLGGPAGIFEPLEHHPFCWGILEHCSKVGTDQCPIQYITFHSKGDGTARGVLDRSLAVLDSFSSKFPNLIGMPIGNDESDIIVTWSNSYDWLADTRYAAMVVKVIKDMYESVTLQRRRTIEVLSNDNAFLNYHPFYFTQRTLFARFQMNHTNPPHSQFIKKPVYSTMALLSLLGDQYLNNISLTDDPLLTIIPTKSENPPRISIILAYHDNATVDTNTIKTINLSLSQLKIGSRFVIYLLDNIRTDPYGLWVKFQRPVFPDKEVRKQLRQVEEPYRLNEPIELTRENLHLAINVTIPSVALINICEEPSTNVGTVTKLSALNVTGNEVLLSWSDNEIDTKCILTYEVEFESKCANSTTFKRINSKDTIFLSYHHSCEGDPAGCESTIGRYRVRALDYWRKAGNYSQIISYP